MCDYPMALKSYDGSQSAWERRHLNEQQHVAAHASTASKVPIYVDGSRCSSCELGYSF